jgi:hypothetical protein
MSPTKEGKTPLHLLCGHQDDKCGTTAVSVLQKLLEQPSIIIHQRNHKGQTPLEVLQIRLAISDSHTARSAHQDDRHIGTTYSLPTVIEVISLYG